ncbi:MAG TPA: DUF4235 domain-containing protein [Streptomyces sp.]|jgi:hypothetical protein|nr:DUF4235 domain-containing protein [Streptomyces sp.]
MGKLFYKVLSIVSGILAGMVAGMIFKQLWKRAVRDEDAPKPTDEERRWIEVLPAAAVEGAVKGVVKAAVGRGQAAGVRRATGNWPA